MGGIGESVINQVATTLGMHLFLCENRDDKREGGKGGGEEITVQPWWLTQRKSPFFHSLLDAF
jgi:hypothetical protein